MLRNHKGWLRGLDCRGTRCLWSHRPPPCRERGGKKSLRRLMSCSHTNTEQTAFAVPKHPACFPLVCGTRTNDLLSVYTLRNQCHRSSKVKPAITGKDACGEERAVVI